MLLSSKKSWLIDIDLSYKKKVKLNDTYIPGKFRVCDLFML